MRPLYVYTPQSGSGDMSASGSAAVQTNASTITIPPIAIQFPVVNQGANYLVTIDLGRSFDSPHYTLWMTSNLHGMKISEELQNKTASKAALLIYVPPNADWSSAGAGAGRPGTDGWVTFSGSARGSGLSTGGTITATAVTVSPPAEISTGSGY